MVDVVPLEAAWRVAVAIADRLPDPYLTSGARPAEIVVRDSGRDVVTFDLAADPEPELRCASLPPMPSSAWVWPMPPAELRRLASTVLRGVPRGASAVVRRPRGRVEGQVISRVLQWLLPTGLAVDVVDVRGDEANRPWWLRDRADVAALLDDDVRRAMWALHVGPEVVAVLHGGWLFTPAGETVNLFARYLTGASIHELGELVLGHKPLPEELPPYVALDATINDDLRGEAGLPVRSDERRQRDREQAWRTWAAHQRRPQDRRKELP